MFEVYKIFNIEINKTSRKESRRAEKQKNRNKS
jgi:hypothetical protein